MTTHYTAWLVNQAGCVAGTQTDVSVSKDDICGYKSDYVGNETPEWAFGELVLEAIETGIDLDDEDRDTKSMRAAEDILAEHGYSVVGPWEYTDNALIATVEREETSA